MVTRTGTVIIGAGPAGLAVGGSLNREGLPFVMLEREDRVGFSWHHHYRRLHLHTDKARSGLPYLPFPKHYPRHPSREQVISYLEAYCEHFGLEPRFGEEVLSTRHQDRRWHTQTRDGLYVSDHLVVATGYNAKPKIPEWDGQEDFPGDILYSSDYKSGEPYRGKRVLVVGFGNSGGEISMDLWEHGAIPTLALRSPVNLLPRDLLGLPLLAVATPLSKLPPRLADALAAPVLWLVFGDLGEFGLRKARGGAFSQIQEHQRVPFIDIGTIKLIRNGQVGVRPGIERFDGEEVVFSDGSCRSFDDVVLATGYRPEPDIFLDDALSVTDGSGYPLQSGRECTIAGLYFCGFHISPIGMLREISIEAKRIARGIARKDRGQRQRSTAE